MLSTTNAKKFFFLETDDLKSIMGYRPKGLRTTLTCYFESDLKALVETLLQDSSSLYSLKARMRAGKKIRKSTSNVMATQMKKERQIPTLPSTTETEKLQVEEEVRIIPAKVEKGAHIIPSPKAQIKKKRKVSAKNSQAEKKVKISLELKREANALDKSLIVKGKHSRHDKTPSTNN